MDTDVDASLLDRVRKIGPVLKANVAEGERLRRLPQRPHKAPVGRPVARRENRSY